MGKWLLFALVVSSPLWAAERHVETAQGEQACINDYLRYCANAVTPETIQACFMRNREKVSPACMTLVRSQIK